MLTGTDAFSLGAGVATSAEKIHPLLLGERIPNVTVVTPDGHPVDLLSEARLNPTILVFYRGGWCPFCNLQLKELKEAEPSLRKLGYQILGISADRPEALRRTDTDLHLKYDLLSDSKMVAARAFGIAFRVDDETVQKYHGYGIDLERASGETHHLLPVPSVFILDQDGDIQFEYVNPNYKVRLNGELLLTAARIYRKTGPDKDR